MTTKPQKLKILFVAAEVAPFATVGGLSQVMYFLPRSLQKMGHDVAIFMPKYATINEKKHKIKLFATGLKVPTDRENRDKEFICNVKVKVGNKYEPTVYFLENMEYYEKRANVYGYNDDSTRFALLSRGALEFLKTINWVPDVIHANDWHTGYLVNYLRVNYKYDKKLRPISTLLTIHNLALQGVIDFLYVSPLESDDGKGMLAPLVTDRLKKQNSLKRGIIYSDVVNTDMVWVNCLKKSELKSTEF